MRILVVEDEHRIAQSLKKGLEQERYAVDLAFNGTDGLDLAMGPDYDLLIVDVMLPGMDGITLCQKLRASDNNTPLLLLTAKGQTRDKVQGLDAGADDYLTKPFSFEELLARVRALTRRPRPTHNSVLVVRDLTLDPANFKVERAGQHIQLSSREFAILDYLMRQANLIVPKQQIIDHVWNYDADILPNTVEVYIKNLRQKIDTPFPKLKPLLQTVRGFGYRLSE